MCLSLRMSDSPTKRLDAKKQRLEAEKKKMCTLSLTHSHAKDISSVCRCVLSEARLQHRSSDRVGRGSQTKARKQNLGCHPLPRAQALKLELSYRRQTPVRAERRQN